MADGWTDLIRLDEVRAGRCVMVRTGGEALLVVHTPGGGVHVTGGICPHSSRVDLGPGRLVEGRIECPMHGAQFDPAGGAVLKGPAVDDLTTYPVTVVDDVVRVYLGPAAPAGHDPEAADSEAADSEAADDVEGACAHARP